MNFQSVLRDLCPPAVPKLARRLGLSPDRNPTDPILFSGDYPSWDEAARASTGYADPRILERTRAAVLKVTRGEAAFERDSVTFPKMEHRFPLLAGLLRAASTRGGRLTVVDFGGALGSTYFQCRQFLSAVTELHWNVVEQPGHVACGRAEFENEQLHFFGQLEEALQSEMPHVLLTSAVVQYLPSPYATLDQLLKCGFDHVIIDRVPFLDREQARLTVQTVPETIYPASYPAWFFSESRFLTALNAAGYRLVADFPGLDTCSPADERAYYKGFILERKVCDADGVSDG